MKAFLKMKKDILLFEINLMTYSSFRTQFNKNL